jgi:metal-sulfur cluster biosynthetic enzyme
MVIDPELGVGIADMGLIYRVQEHDGVVVVTMTLTSMGCPAGPQLTEDIDSVLRMQKDVKDVEIEVVWEPAWNPEMMNPQIRQMLFGGP